MLLRSAKAGLYKPSLLGKLYGLIYPSTGIKERSLLETEVTLLDISFYQMSASFPVMLSNGVRGVIIRAGQNTWADNHANIYMNGAEEAGMPYGSYWFYDSRIEPKEQAKKWKEVLGDRDVKLYCWADYEENFGGAYGGWRHFYDFLEECKRIMPNRKFGIYTGYYYWIEHSPSPLTQAANLAYFAQYPLWLAWYVSDVSYVKIPKPWTKMLFWQYTSSGDGIFYGVGSKEVDKNRFMGTLEEFNQLFNLKNGETPMPTVNWKGTCISGPAVVRDAPAGADTGNRVQVGQAVEAVGELVTAGANNYKWRNIVSPYTGWVADQLLSGSPVSADCPKHTVEVYVDGVLEFTKEF